MNDNLIFLDEIFMKFNNLNIIIFNKLSFNIYYM